MCTWCWTAHAVALVAERARAAVDAEVELTSARDLARTTWQGCEIPAYPDLSLRRGALVTVVGPSGAGKSTLVTRSLASLPDTTLLLSVEEPAGPSLAERLARAGARSDRLLVCSRATVDQVGDIIRKRKVAALGVDSVQRSLFESRELRHLLVVLPSLAVVFAVSQINRDGDVRGGEELAHESDVIVEVAELAWTVRKSRYQPAGTSGAVLARPAPLPPEEVHVSA
jgi:hypothetical protein